MNSESVETAVLDGVGQGIELRRSLSELLSFGHRFTGSAGEAGARAYLAARFARMGLEVEQQPLSVRTYLRDRAAARVISAGRETSLECKAFAYSPETDGVLALDLVNGGTGDFAVIESLGGSIRGKAVYCRPGDEMRSKRHRNLTERGAAAGVFGSHVSHHDACIISYVRDTAVTPIPAIGLNRTSTMRLEEIMASGPASLEIEISGKTVHASSANLIATLRGTSTLPEIVIGGHLDTYDLCEGALDNTAGAAVILEAARVMSRMPRPVRTVRFVLFTAEEVSCLGSRKYVAERLPDPGGCGLFLNVDMPVEGGVPGLLKASGAGEDGWWSGLAGGLKPFPIRQFSSRDSDHAPFVELGVPAVWIRAFDTGARGPAAIEHTVLDTGDKVGQAELVESALLTASLLVKLAMAPALPFGPFDSPKLAA